MNDKEKQILAIAQDLSDCLEYDIEDSSVVDTYDTAYKLTNKGWVKLPEDSIVIPKKITEETTPETLIKIAKYNDTIRKETAEKILEKGQYNMPEWLKDWIVEQFGVEIKE